MDQVYARAASLICSTLDIDGCFILDLGQFESVDVETERGIQSVYRADPYSAESTVLELSGTFGPVNPFPVLASNPAPVPTRALTGEEHRKMSDFLMNHRDGRIFEKVAPSWIRYLFPSDLRYGMGKSPLSDSTDHSRARVRCQSAALCAHCCVQQQQG
jgi:hypothetical protein